MVQLPPPAYRVPFRFQKVGAGSRHLLLNASDETVESVALVIHGPGLLRVTSPVTLHSGASLELRVAARDRARATVMVVSWFRDDGLEYVWRVSV